MSTLISAKKLLGVLDLSTDTQKALVCAYALDKLYGYAYARDTQLRAQFRHLARITLMKRRPGRSAVYDIEPLGRDIVHALGVSMTLGNPDGVPAWVTREGDLG